MPREEGDVLSERFGVARKNWMSFAAAILLVTGSARAGGPAPAAAPAATADQAEQARALDAPLQFRRRIWLGVFIEDAVDGGIQIIDVVPGGPAARAGLARGDVLIRANDSEVANLQDLRRATESLSPGDVLTVTLLRNGARRQVRVVPANPPPPGWVVPKPPAGPPRPSPAPDLSFDLPTGGEMSAADVLGVGVEEIPSPLREYLGGPAGVGLLVTRVDADGPCAGRLRPGDLLVRVAALPLESLASLDRAVLRRRTGGLRLEGFRAKAPFAAEISVPIPAAGDAERSARILLLERSIRDLEASLDAMKRELAKLKTKP
jgi:membrane-associated protease RseP (regulator of RpoE activity)